MTEQNRLSDFGTGTTVEEVVFECKVCGYSTKRERTLFSHIERNAGDSHPKWDDLPVRRKVENGGCFGWQVTES